ncbi:hypothetical protein ILUMI_02149 [Ignelater luminosus]|uniref:FAS-associated factor 1 n=1 Tax=Ignelater luminosus TaxID=2038154 RepID=A0A8K0DIA2_IGNLU|nr:hypothetical protein ILUMI_02149 [Ignelater luminosus]
MAQNREEILADFQACTGIDDVAEAIYHLDETDWDLLRAVNRVVPADSQSFASGSAQDVVMIDDDVQIPEAPIETATDMVSVGNNVPLPKPLSMPILENNIAERHSQPSTSTVKNNTPRMLRFNIQYCDRTIPIDIPDTGTIADIKLNLSKELKIAPCRQLLSGWARLVQFETTPLSQLMLPKENTIHLHVKRSGGGFSAEDEAEVTERLKGTYMLKITDENTNKQYNLKYQGTKTILEVKTDVYTLTDIHVRNQVWSGWPPNIDDQTVLALSGISYPEHELTLKRNTVVNHTREKKPNNTVEIHDSDDDEYEDATETFTVDDEMFVDNLTSKRIEPLIPEHVEDEIVGSISFSEQFSARYGPIHAPFYQGTLEDALKEACPKSAKDRKILAVYLHHDASVLSNVFCTQLLGCESVIQTLETNFILWGWDLTFESNRTALQNSVNRCLGPTAALSLRNIPIDRLPAIIIIMRIRSSTDVFSVVHGNVGVNELLSSLIEAVEVFMEHQRVEMKEEDERAARELVKWEQDQAYRESLEADRAKEEAKRMQEQALHEERKRVETEKVEEAARKEAYRKQVEAALPPEPLDQGDNIAKIRFRLPKGESLERRFQANTPLKVLLNYLIVKGYPTEEYKVISSWPRRDLTSLDSNLTLQELKLCPQETVILEER